MAAITLVDTSAHSTSDLTKSVIETYVKENLMLALLPFEAKKNLRHEWYKEKSMPTIDFRGSRETYTASRGELDPQTIHLKYMGGKTEIDINEKDVVGFDEVEENDRQMRMLMKTHAIDFSYWALKGDVGVNKKAFDGIYKLINMIQPFTGNEASRSTNLVYTGDTNTTGQVIDDAYELVDEMNRFIDAGRGLYDFALAPQAMLRKIKALSLTSAANNPLAGIFEYEKYMVEINGNQYTHRRGIWDGILPILPMKRDTQNRIIMGFDEYSPNEANQLCGSIVGLCVGDGAAYGVQKKASGPDIRPYDESASGGSSSGVVIDHPVAITADSQDCMVRMRGFRLS